MFGWIYLILAVFLGREITRKLVPENKIRETKVAPLWVTFPAAFGVGILFYDLGCVYCSLVSQ